MKTMSLAVLLSSLALPAFCAETPKPSQAIYIVQFDTNHDGVMTEEEYREGRKERISSTDTNKDGKISREEFGGGTNPWHPKWDKNHDGMVAPGEYIEFYCGKAPAKGDKTKAENAEQYYYECVAYRQAVFAVKDTNKDGKLSPKEIADSNAAVFDKSDKNKDGYLEQDEFFAFGAELDDQHEAEIRSCRKQGNCGLDQKKPETSSPSKKPDEKEAAKK